MYTPPVYTTVRTVQTARNIISSPATFAYFICMYAESVPPQLAIHDVKEIHAAYRRAYVLSLLTWPRTCTHPRHAHRGSDALIALPCAGLIYPCQYRLTSDQPRQQLSIVGIVSFAVSLRILFFFSMNCA